MTTIKSQVILRETFIRNSIAYLLTSTRMDIPYNTKCHIFLGSAQNVSNIEVAISTIALNYSIILAGVESEELEEAAFQMISALGTVYLDRFTSVEALYRTVIAIGNLLWLDVQKNCTAKDLAQALEIKSALSKCRRGNDKLKEATQECDKLLS